MGQVLACCTVAEANDDTMYRPPPQEIEKPWKEKVETIEGKVDGGASCRSIQPTLSNSGGHGTQHGSRCSHGPHDWMGLQAKGPPAECMGVCA